MRDSAEVDPPFHGLRVDADLLGEAAVGEAGRSRAGEVALLVAEWATSALIHGSLRGRLFRVHLSVTGGAIRIEVSDPRGERLPGLREADRDECYGRGFVIVDAVADRWGVEPRAAGKTVFAELALQTRPHRLGTSRQASDRTTTTRRPRV